MNEYQERLEEVAKRLASEGQLVQAGWIGYRMKVIPQSAGMVQVEECQRAFMAGATHLFFSLLSALDPDSEPTEGDLDKMGKIHEELARFAGEAP